MTGLTSGSFLYLSINEILVKGLKDKENKNKNIAMFCLGLALIIAMLVLFGAEHGHEEEEEEDHDDHWLSQIKHLNVTIIKSIK